MSEHGKSHPFDPHGKVFKQRLAAFLHDAKVHYGVTIGQDHGRTPEWSQTMHICHMFLYNAFAHSKPKHRDKINHRTIDWDYMKDAKVTWRLVKYTELLRTADGRPPEKLLMKWKEGMEPDRQKSEENMKRVLVAGGCMHEGKEMIACGVRPCGEPCGCPTGTSKHLDGLAADLKMHALETLTHKLSVAKAGTLDHLLHLYGLHRPMIHHKHPEAWHVEAIPDVHPVDHTHHPGHHRARHRLLEYNDLLLPCPNPQRLA